MSHDHLALPHEESVRTAARRLRDTGLDFAAVRHGRKLVGTVTIRGLVDHVLAEGLDPDETVVGDVMRDECSTVSRDDELEVAIARMCDHRTTCLVALDDAGAPCGVLTLVDIAHAGHAELAGAALATIVPKSGPPSRDGYATVAPPPERSATA